MIKLTDHERYILSSLLPYNARSSSLGGPGLTDHEVRESYGERAFEALSVLSELGLAERKQRGRWVVAEFLYDGVRFGQENWQRFKPKKGTP